MKEGWEYKKFTDVCDVQYGFAFDSKCFTDDDNFTPLIRIRDVLRGYSDTFYNGDIPDGYYINEGDYLVGMDGEFNIGIWGKRPGLLNQRVCKMASSSDSLHNGYMFYFLKVCLKKIEDETPFVTVKHLSAKRINQIEIPLPPLEVQQSIVAELDLINDVIAKKKAQLKDLDSLAQSLFYEMFGDPVENEMGWEVKKLGEVCYAQNGLVDPRISPYDEMLHVGPANIASHTGDLVGLKKAKEENLISGKYLFKPGMLLYSKIRPNLNKVTIAHFEGICSADMYPLICNENVNEVFLLNILRSKCFLDYAIANSGRANIPKINRESLFAFKFPLPPLSLQQTFATRIEAIEEEKQKIQSSLKALENLLASRMQYWFD